MFYSNLKSFFPIFCSSENSNFSIIMICKYWFHHIMVNLTFWFKVHGSVAFSKYRQKRFCFSVLKFFFRFEILTKNFKMGRIELFSEKNFSGSCQGFVDSFPALGYRRVCPQSAIVENGSWTIYSNLGFQGKFSTKFIHLSYSTLVIP